MIVLTIFFPFCALRYSIHKKWSHSWRFFIFCQSKFCGHNQAYIPFIKTHLYHHRADSYFPVSHNQLNGDCSCSCSRNTVIGQVRLIVSQYLYLEDISNTVQQTHTHKVNNLSKSQNTLKPPTHQAECQEDIGQFKKTKKNS